MLYMLKLEPVRPPQISKSPPGDITSVGNLWCQLGPNSKAGTIACKGALPRGFGPLRALTAFSVTLNMYPLPPTPHPFTESSASPHSHPEAKLVPAPKNREAQHPLLGLETEPSPFQMGRRADSESAWVRPVGRGGQDSFLKVPPSILPSHMGGAFPEYSSLPSTVWIFVWNIAPNASPVLSQFTHVYSGFSIILLTVPLSKYLLSSLSERTRVSEDPRSKDLSCHPGEVKDFQEAGRPETEAGLVPRWTCISDSRGAPGPLTWGVSLSWD